MVKSNQTMTDVEQPDVEQITVPTITEEELEALPDDIEPADYVKDEGECPFCGDRARVAGFNNTVRDGEGRLWHETCLYRAFGWDYYTHEEAEEDGDVPWCSNSNRYYNLHKTRWAEIGGERFEWDEWVCVDAMAGDHGQYGMPTRDSLSNQQLEELRQGEHTDPAHGKELISGLFCRPDTGTPLPAYFILQGGYTAPQHWVCPDCGEIIDLGDQRSKRRRSPEDVECDSCGSERWLSYGEPLSTDDEQGFDMLSDRERQTVLLKGVLGQSDKEIAEAMGVKPSTVREYAARARQKAIRGANLYEWLKELLDLEQPGVDFQNEEEYAEYMAAHAHTFSEPPD